MNLCEFQMGLSLDVDRKLYLIYFFASKELIACGSANILGSFFSCFPVSGSLSRSVIQESIARTQVFKNNYYRTTSKVYPSCSFFF